MLSALHELFPLIPSQPYEGWHFYVTILQMREHRLGVTLVTFPKPQSQWVAEVGPELWVCAWSWHSDLHTGLGCSQRRALCPWMCILFCSSLLLEAPWFPEDTSGAGHVVSAYPYVPLLARHQHVLEHFNVWTCLRSSVLPPSMLVLSLACSREGRVFLICVCVASSPKSGIFVLCHCLLPILRAQRWYHLPLWSGTTWTHATALHVFPSTRDTSRSSDSLGPQRSLLGPDRLQQNVGCSRWLEASVPALLWGPDM